jgi:hypothetical protein
MEFSRLQSRRNAAMPMRIPAGFPLRLQLRCRECIGSGVTARYGRQSQMMHDQPIPRELDRLRALDPFLDEYVRKLSAGRCYLE